MLGLVLSRKRGECIAIGDDIIIRVEMVRSGQSRLRIVAPKDVEIHRAEVHEPTRQRVEELGLLEDDE